MVTGAATNGKLYGDSFGLFFFFNLLSGVCEASDNSLAEEKGIFFII